MEGVRPEEAHGHMHTDRYTHTDPDRGRGTPTPARTLHPRQLADGLMDYAMDAAEPSDVG